MTETCSNGDQFSTYSEMNSPLLPSDTSTAPFSIPTLAQDTKVNIQVGERKFTTTRETLVGGSDYFASRFSGRWNDPEPDGSYFVDGDPDMFVHILRFLRSGAFPLFYDKNRGHNYALYTALLAESQYFQIPPLVDWLREKRYRGRIVTYREASIVDSLEALNRTTESWEDVEYHYAWKYEKIYVCPRRIYVHKGVPERCGQACEKARGTAGYEYEENPVLKVLVVRKKTVLVD